MITRNARITLNTLPEILTIQGVNKLMSYTKILKKKVYFVDK